MVACDSKSRLDTTHDKSTKSSEKIGKFLSNIHCIVNSFSKAYAFATLALLAPSWSIWLILIIFMVCWWAGFISSRDIYYKPVPELINTFKQGGLLKPNIAEFYWQKTDGTQGLILDNCKARYVLVLNTSTKCVFIYDRYTLKAGQKINNEKLNFPYKKYTKIATQLYVKNNINDLDATNRKIIASLFSQLENIISSNIRKICIGITSAIVGISVGLMHGIFVCHQVFNFLLFFIKKYAMLDSIYPYSMIMIPIIIISSALALITTVCVSALYTKHVVTYCQDPQKFAVLTEVCRELFNFSSPNCRFIIRKLTAISGAQLNTSDIEFIGNQAWVIFYAAQPDKYYLAFIDKNQSAHNLKIYKLDSKILANQAIRRKIAQLINNPMKQLSLTFNEYNFLNRQTNNPCKTRIVTITQRIINLVLCFIGSSLSLIGVYMTMNSYVTAAKSFFFSHIPKLASTVIDAVGFGLACTPRAFFAITSILETYNFLLKKAARKKHPHTSFLLNFATFFNSFSYGCIALQGGLHSPSLHKFIALCINSISTSPTVIQCSAALSGLSGFINAACTIIARGSRWNDGLTSKSQATRDVKKI